MSIRKKSEIFAMLAAIPLLGPFIVVPFIEQEWIARFSGNMLMFVMLFIGCTALALNKKLEHEWPEDPPLVKRYGKKKIVLGFRIFCLALAVLWIYLLVPFGKDLVLIANQEAPLSQRAVVRDVSYTSLTGWFSQDIILDQEIYPNDDSLNAMYFLPRQIEEGNTYEFLYMPNTELIVEARLMKKGSSD